MKCIITANPYPVLNGDRVIECIIPVHAYSLIKVHSREIVYGKKYLLKVTDFSRWLHFRKTRRNHCFIVSGRISRSLITASGIVKMRD